MAYSDNHNKAIKGESYIFQELLGAGIEVEWLAINNRKSLADFQTKNGKTIDAKVSHINKGGYWTFNFQDHGKKQIGIDYYVCMLVDGDDVLIFIFPQNLVLGHSLRITRGQLDRGRYDYFKNNWALIK